MAKGKSARYSIPDKIEPIERPSKPRTSRKDWQKRIQEQLQFYRKVNNRAQTKGSIDPFDFDGAFAERKTEALLNTLETIYERYKFVVAPDENPNDLGDEWIHLNLSFTSYSSIEAFSHILFGAALWILDHIASEDEKRYEMYRYLPTDDYALEEVYTPDVWDCQHDCDLIASVQYVLHYRNADIAGIEDDGQGNERVITDRASAAGTHRTDLPGRTNFEGLISLISKEDIERAVKHFEEYFWAWSDRYFACLKPLMQEIAACKERVEGIRVEYNATCDELAAAMDTLDKRFREQKRATKKNGRVPTANPLMVSSVDLSAFSLDTNALSSLTGRAMSTPENMIESDPILLNALMLSMKADRLDDQFDDAAGNWHSALDSKNKFMLDITRRGRIFRHDCEEDYGTAVAEAMTELPITDPYELCFALVYLVDQGSDLPWLYGTGTGLMEEVTEALPWGIIEYDEMDDAIWEGEPISAKPSAIPDWYERKYHRKGDNLVDFPRSLAQIVYEETGCLMPRDMHRYDSRVKDLGRYGIRGKDALTILSCMTALSNARRSTTALNFKPELLDIILNDDASSTEAAADEASAADLSDQVNRLRDEIRRLKEALHESDRASRDTKKELAAFREKAAMEHRELADLRELVFKSENDEDPYEEAADETLFPYEVQKDTIVFGGHDTWQKAIKPLLRGSIRFIDRGLVFDTSIIRHVDVVWIQSNAISHKQYYRVVDTARQYSKPVRYFTYASAAKCAEQLAENDTV